ncbi:MAG: hypothetical protein ACLGIG_09280 [Actinomycetes bacterium]
MTATTEHDAGHSPRTAGAATPASRGGGTRPRHVLLGTDRAVATALFFGLWLLYLLTAGHLFQSIDTNSMYFPAWQLAHHGNITMDAHAHELGFWVEAGGRVVSDRFPGAMWLATPFYLIDPFAEPLPLMANCAAAAATAGAMTVLFFLLRRLTTRRTALTAVLVAALATPTWTVSGDALWTHGPGQLWLVSGVFLAACGRHLGSGLSFAAAILTRPHYAVVAAAVGVGASLRQRRFRPMVLVGIGSGLGVVGLIAWNFHVYGAADPRGGYASDSRTRSLDPTGLPLVEYLERVAGTLVSPSRGVLVLTPFLLLLLPGLVTAWRRSPAWSRSAAMGGLLYMIVQLRGNDWMGGYSFYSYRLALEWLTLSAPLLVVAYQSWTAHRAWRRRVFTALVTFSVAVHGVGAVLYRGDGAGEPEYWTHWPPLALLNERQLATLTIGLATAVVALAVPRVLRRVADAPCLHRDVVPA